LGYGPNEQKLRFPASPEIAVSSLCGNKVTACQVDESLAAVLERQIVLCYT